MSAWLVFLIVAVIFFFVEIYTPTMFFLNFALASLICAFLGIFTSNYNLLVPVFVILSIVFILFLRPLLNIRPQKTALISSRDRSRDIPQDRALKCGR